MRVRKNTATGVFEASSGRTKEYGDDARAALRSRLPSVGTNIFTVMSKLAAEVGAINLSQGFPDFDCDPALIDAVARHMRAGLNQYAPMPGVLALRQAIAAKYARSHGRHLRPRDRGHGHVGRHRGDLRRGRRVVHPGDEVIVLEPCYDSYVPAIELNGGVPVVGLAAAARLPHRLGRGRGGDHAAHPAADASTRRTIRPARS